MQNDSLKSKPRSGAALMVGAVMIALLVVALCVFRESLAPVGYSSLPAPQESVAGFFEALRVGDSEGCDAYISGYSTLGMDAGSPSAVTAALRERLNESYSYSFVGECEIDGMEARQEVEVTYLDLSLLGEPLRLKTNEVAEEMNYQGEEIHDEASAERTMLEAIERMSGGLSAYYVTERLTVRLESDGSAWRIKPDSGFSRVIMGNVGNA